MGSRLASRRPITELIQSAELFAAAQETMAARAKEDSQHWHHVAIAELLRDMAVALSSQQGNTP